MRGEGEAVGAFQIRAPHPAFVDREWGATLHSDSCPVAPGAANHCPNLTASYPPTPTESSEENLPKMALGGWTNPVNSHVLSDGTGQSAGDPTITQTVLSIPALTFQYGCGPSSRNSNIPNKMTGHMHGGMPASLLLSTLLAPLPGQAKPPDVKMTQSSRRSPVSAPTSGRTAFHMRVHFQLKSEDRGWGQRPGASGSSNQQVHAPKATDGLPWGRSG